MVAMLGRDEFVTGHARTPAPNFGVLVGILMHIPWTWNDQKSIC